MRVFSPSILPRGSGALASVSRPPGMPMLVRLLGIARASGRLVHTGLTVLRARRGEEKALRALTDLDDERLTDLSEHGQQLRRMALMQTAARAGWKKGRAYDW